MIGWLRRGAAAASLAGNRGDLWPAGALASLVYLGWLPLLLVVAPPDPDALAYFGISLITSGSYPANVVALSVTAVATFVLLCLLAAVSEIALAASLLRAPAVANQRSSMSALATLLVATLPAIAAVGLLVTGIIGQAAGAFTSPDLDTPVFVRLALALLPHLAVLLAGVLLAQVFGGLALRFAVRETGRGTADAILQALRRLRRDAWGPLGVALAGLVKDLVLFAISYVLLRVLWSPVAAGLSSGLLSSPQALILLVGFVATWLVLLLMGGALHVAISAWWTAELAPSSPPVTIGHEVEAQPDALGGHHT